MGRRTDFPAVEDLVNGVAKRENNGAPVVQRVVEREDRRFLPPVGGLGGRERRRDLVDQLSLLPELPGEVEKHFSCAATFPNRVGVPNANPSAHSRSSIWATGSSSTAERWRPQYWSIEMRCSSVSSATCRSRTSAPSPSAPSATARAIPRTLPLAL